MKSIDIGTGLIRFELQGSGPLVVLDHALGPEAWGWPVDRLAATCTVAALDFERQDGDPRPLRPPGLLRALVAELGFEQVTLCAWSMAGMKAIRYAVELPPELSKLVLVDIAGLGSPEAPSALEQLSLEEVDDPVRVWVDTAWRSWVRRTDLDTSRLRERTYRSLNTTAESFRRNLKANREAQSTSLLEELARIEVPTLVMAGRWSDVLGPEVGSAAVERLAQGQLAIFEDSAHAIQLEEPERFQDQVIRFVGS